MGRVSEMRLHDEIGISISPVRPAGLSRTTMARSHCTLAGLARAGDSLYAQNEDISCPLARFVLGLEERSPEGLRELAATLVSWNDAQDQEAAMKYLNSAPTLVVGVKFISYFPLPDRRFVPDVVVRVGSPEQIMPLVRSTTRITGHRTPALASGVGGMCSECTAIPLATGRANISLGCTGSRPGARLAPDQLLLALPLAAHRLLTGGGR